MIVLWWYLFMCTWCYLWCWYEFAVRRCVNT